MQLKIFIILGALIALGSEVSAQKKVVCYWMPGIPASAINPWTCSHIIYSFLGIDAWGGLNYLWRPEWEVQQHMRDLVGLRNQRPELRVLVAIGGYNPALIGDWSAMAANPDARWRFAENVKYFLDVHGLNGVDIDWEFPNYGGDAPQDRHNFVLLLQTLKQVVGHYSVSAAIGAGRWRTDLSYDIPAIFANTDFVNLMAYDLHGSWESITGIHAALYSGPLDPTDANVDASVQLLLGYGIDRSKLILGIPAYGNSFQLQNPNNNNVGAPASGYGSMKYSEICQRIRQGSLDYRWEESQMVPYAFSGYEWVGYDDRRSVVEKAHYINRHNLGGAMFWSLDDEDYTDACAGGTFPLIWAVFQIVHG